MLATASAVVGSSCLAAMAETRTFGVICRLFSSSPTARSEPRWLGSTVEWYWVNRITLERREVVVNCEAELKWQSGERGTRSCDSPIVPCSSILPAHVMFIFFLIVLALIGNARVCMCARVDWRKPTTTALTLHRPICHTAGIGPTLGCRQSYTSHACPNLRVSMHHDAPGKGL